MTTVKTYFVRNGQIIPATVECRITPGIGIYITGPSQYGTKEALRWVTAALAAINFHLPGKKIELAISPDSESTDTNMDAAIATALILEHNHRTITEDIIITGELRPDGTAACTSETDNIIKFHNTNNSRGTLLHPIRNTDTEEDKTAYSSLADIMLLIPTDKQSKP